MLTTTTRKQNSEDCFSLNNPFVYKHLEKLTDQKQDHQGLPPNA